MSTSDRHKGRPAEAGLPKAEKVRSTISLERRCVLPEVLAALIDGGLGSNESAKVRQHLGACDRCYAIFIRSARSVQRGVEESEPPSSLTERLMAWWLG